MDQEKLKELRAFADLKYEIAYSEGNGDSINITDFKIDMDQEQLTNIIGKTTLDELEQIFGNSFDEIILRRC